MARFVGLDVHKQRRRGLHPGRGRPGRGPAPVRPGRAGPQRFARTQLRPDDRVVLEATTNTWAVARAVRPLVAEVVVVQPDADQGDRPGQGQDRQGRRPTSWPSCSAATSCPRVWEPDEAHPGAAPAGQPPGRAWWPPDGRQEPPPRRPGPAADPCPRSSALQPRPASAWLRGLELDERGPAAGRQRPAAARRGRSRDRGARRRCWPARPTATSGSSC